MVKISVDPALCRKDAICATVCPTRFIQAKPGELPVARTGQTALCLQCGQCMAFCPHGAIEVEGLARGNLLPIDRQLLPTPESTALLLESRRSIRLYKTAQVPRETLSRLIEVASYAPSAKNERSIRYIVLYEREKMQELGDCLASCFEEETREKGKTAATVEGRQLAASWRRGNDPLFRGAPHVAVAVAPSSWAWGHEDGVISLTYLEIIANAYGIGACWAGYLTGSARRYPKIREFLGVGEDEMVCGGQILGYPRIFPRSTAPRAAYPVTWL